MAVQEFHKDIRTHLRLLARQANANLDETEANALYLRLDTANDPLTGDLAVNVGANASSNITIGETTTLRGDSQNGVLRLYGEHSGIIYGSQFNQTSGNLQLLGLGVNPATTLQSSLDFDLISGATLRVRDATNVDSVTISHDGTNGVFDTTGIFDFKDSIQLTPPVGGARVSLQPAVGDAILELFADPTNTVETDNPYIHFRQDGTAVNGYVGYSGGAGIGPSGEVLTNNNVTNSFVIHNTHTDPIHFGIANVSYFYVDSSEIRAYAPLQVHRSTGPHITLRDTDSTGNAHVSWMRFEDSAATRRGFVGFGSSGNDNLALLSDNGGIDIEAQTQIDFHTGGNIVRGSFLSGGDFRMESGNDINWANATQPWLTLDSNGGGGGNWQTQGAGISIGESGKKGSAALHFTYRGDGTSYIGSGVVQDTGDVAPAGEPNYSALRFNYNTAQVSVQGRFYPGIATGGTGASIGFQTTGYIEDASAQNYGTINVAGVRGTSGTWAGYSVNRRVVLMNNNSTTGGLYNDTNDEWFIQFVENSYVRLYHNGVEELRTQDSNASDQMTGAAVKHFDQVLYPIGIGPLPHTNISASTNITDTHQLKAVRWTSGAAGLDTNLLNDATIRVNSWGMIWNESGSDKDIVQGTGVTIYWFDGAGGQTGTRVLADGGCATWTKISDTLYRLWGVGIS